MRGSFALAGAATVFLGLTVSGSHCVANADAGADAPSVTASAGAADSAKPVGPQTRKARKSPISDAAFANSDGGAPRAAVRGTPNAVPRAVAAKRGPAPETQAVEAPSELPVVTPKSSKAVSAPLTAALTAPAAATTAAPAPTTVPVALVRPTAASATAAAAPLPVHPAAATASARSIGTGLNTALTETANWLAELPGGPVSQLLEGAVYLVRRTLFPTSVGVVVKPVMVPLTLTDIYGGPNKKLGIWVGIGSDATPAIFELDTGGAGIYGAYASASPNNSPWWGNGAVTTSTPVQVTYDSGNSYTGFAATSQVYLFAPGGTSPLLSTGRATVGQMDNISNGSTELWTPDGLPPGQTHPPVDATFYGDFGLAQQYADNQISNVLAQLTYARGVLPGYRIHVDEATNTAWLQIGLTKADTQDPSGAYFPMVIDPTAPSTARNPHSHLRYYSPQVFKANIKISTIQPAVTTVINSLDVGMTADTGADTTLHNTNLTSIPLPTQYAGITEKGHLEAGLNFNVTGTTKSGAQGQVFNFTTLPNDAQKPNLQVVGVQNNKPGNTTYYLNTGILLFYQNDVVYSLGDRSGGGLIGLISHGSK